MSRTMMFVGPLLAVLAVSTGCVGSGANVAGDGDGDSPHDDGASDSTACVVGEAPMPCQCAGIARSTFCNNGVRTCDCGGGTGAVGGGTGAVGGGTGAIGGGTGAVGGGTGAVGGGTGATGGGTGATMGTGGMQGTGATQGTGGMQAPAGCGGGLTCGENSFVSGVMPGFTFCGMMGGFGHEPPPCGANMDCSAYPGSSCQNLMVIEGCIESCTP